MFIPEGYAQITHMLGGSAWPNGAAVVYGVNQVDAAAAVDVANSAHSAFASNVIPQLVNSVSLLSTLAKLGPEATGASALSTGAVFAGGSAAAGASPNVAYLWIKNTALGGRRGRGRLYIPGVAESVVDAGGGVLPGTVTSQQTAATAWLSAMASANISMQLLHGPPTVWALINGQPRRIPVGAAPGPTPVTSIVPQALVATQRRRLRG